MCHEYGFHAREQAPKTSTSYMFSFPPYVQRGLCGLLKRVCWRLIICRERRVSILISNAGKRTCMDGWPFCFAEFPPSARLAAGEQQSSSRRPALFRSACANAYSRGRGWSPVVAVRSSTTPRRRRGRSVLCRDLFRPAGARGDGRLVSRMRCARHEAARTHIK